MTEMELLDLLKTGEKVDIECKEASNEVPKSLWESYSAMSNTNGGIIVLGIKEVKKTGTFELQGVNNVNNRVKDFWNTINGNKTNKNLLVDEDLEVLTVEGK
ncbi:MAG: AlbA family DNA-binding domain-containing protein, partial [Peptostreptococcaceae bacterium]